MQRTVKRATDAFSQLQLAKVHPQKRKSGIRNTFGFGEQAGPQPGVRAPLQGEGAKSLLTRKHVEEGCAWRIRPAISKADPRTARGMYFLPGWGRVYMRACN